MENTQENITTRAFLSMRDLVKVYPNGEKAVYNFNLDINKNEFIVIVGPSGCGKSTTLRMIAGLEDVSSGDIYMQGELINYKPSSERKMAIVFQSYALYPQMNVYDNIAFPLTINKYPMPKVNVVLKANSEIENVLALPFNKLIGVLYNVNNSKGKVSQKAEQIATIFNITLFAAELLFKSFGAFKQYTLEELETKESDYNAAVRAEIEPLVRNEKNIVESKGIKLNGDFCEVDDIGNVIIEMRKYTHYEIKTRVYDTAEKLDLIPYLDKLPKELSGGQMQRVALGRAIIKNVPVFMMDEPLSNLDAKLRLTMRSEIVKLHNKINATTIYVTHDQTEAMTMATRIVVMSRGFIQQIGTPEEVYNNPVNIFVAKFIGSPSMNIFTMKYNPESSTLSSGETAIILGSDFKQRHDCFYDEKVRQFENMIDSFGEREKEYLLKILSATGEGKDRGSQVKKKGLIAFVRRLIEKRKNKDVVIDEYAYEKGVFSEKLESLRSAKSQSHSLTIGIRPERLVVSKNAIADKEYQFNVRPTVCELLGGEYNIHFDLFGMDMVCKIDAAEKIVAGDELFVGFSPTDLYIFDTVTGDII